MGKRTSPRSEVFTSRGVFVCMSRGDKTDFSANTAKHMVWERVLSGFSAVFGSSQELKELKDQWKRTKQATKKEWQGQKDHV